MTTMTLEKTNRLKEIRRRLRDDYAYYAKNALKIRTKEGEIKPLVLNQAQQVLQEAIDKQRQETGKVRIIVLKGRQQGLSTDIGGYFYWDVSQREAAKALVIAHTADSTKALFAMTKRYHDNCPKAVQPHTKYSSRQELVFDVLDSGYMVATAGGEGIARGETITHLHASELAFWKASTARDNWNGIFQSVPDVAGTSVFIESTANGVTGVFYETWKEAVKGTNGFIPVFIPWFIQDEYRSEVPSGFTPTPDEEDLMAKYGLDYGQLQWRRRKVANNGLDLFRQEYPCNPDEAFLTSGRPVFHPEMLHELLKKETQPIERMGLEPVSNGEEISYEFKEHARGELFVYKKLELGEQYFIGADVGGGVKGDYSVAQILDSKRQQIAIWRSHTVQPDAYAQVLYSLGEMYNMAMIAVENNNHGILPVHLLAKEMYYPYIYQEVQHDKITDAETVRLGFTTTVKSKPMIIDRLRGSFRTKQIDLSDITTLQEMQTFVITESGKMEADADCHDDCVMSLAIANYLVEDNAEPIENKDEWYTEVI